MNNLFLPDSRRLFTNSSYLAVVLPGFHVAAIFLIYHLLVFLFDVPHMSIFQFKAWDAWWYTSIAEKGYVFSAEEPSNVAFYPFFPYLWKALWKFTGAGVEGVCLFNACSFFAGLLMLRGIFGFSWWYFLFFAAIPSNMFMLVPYTEALFFLFCTLFIVGLEKKNLALQLCGLFLASLTRPTAYFFFPALVLMELFCSDSLRQALKRAVVLALAPFTALLIVVFIQYRQTGVWFAYFRDGWHRELALPDFPITSWGGASTIWLDGAAFFICMLSLAALLALGIRWLRGGYKKPERAAVFSVTYLVMPGLSALLLGSYDDGGGTTLASLNRYIMGTAFFTTALYYFTHHVKLDVRTIVISLLLLLCTYLLLDFEATGFSEYEIVHRRLYPVYMLCPLVVFFLVHKRFGEKFLPLGYFLNLFILVMLLNRFSQGVWVG